MKILVCTDGSEQSQKALEKTSMIANGCNADEVAVIHVYIRTPDVNFINGMEAYSLKKDDMDRFRAVGEQYKERGKIILAEALKFLKEKNIEARAICKEGHPSHTIVNIGYEEKFDLIVVGSRGFSGLQKLFLGSVSNAVVQEAKNCSVLIVK